MFTLIEASIWGWGSGKTIAGFAVAAVLIAAFVIIERRHAASLVPLRIFSDRRLAASDVTFFLVAAGLFGTFFFTTLYFEQVLGYTALKTGVAYLPLSLTLISASALASRLVDRFLLRRAQDSPNGPGEVRLQLEVSEGLPHPQRRRSALTERKNPTHASTQPS